MAVEITSTTDTPEQVMAAMGQSESKSESEVEETNAASSDESVDETDTESVDESATSEADEEIEESEESEDTGEESKDEKPKAKKKSGLERRFAKLNRTISDKDSEIEHWKSKYFEQQKEAVPEETKQAESFESSERPVKPIEDNFETYEEYLAAQDEYLEKLTDWKVEQRFKEREESQAKTKAKTAYETKVSAHAERIEKFKESHPDFDDVLADAQDWARPTVALESLVIESEIGDQLTYELLKDRELFDSINSLDPLKMGVAIGRLEAKFQKDNSSAQTTKTQTTKAPPPVNPVGGKSTRATKKTVYDVGSDFKAYERLRREQQRGA